MISLDVPARPAGVAAIAGGLLMIVIGVAAAIDADIAGPGWFIVAGIAAGLLVVAVLGLRTVADGVRGTRAALTVAATALALFGLAHFFALLDADTAILLFSVFMVLASACLVVAGIVVARAAHWPGMRRFVPLLCGVWPLATIPAGAAIGDLPHFLAIAGWGGCWTALGVVLLTAVATAARPAPQPAL
jgi:hypothetical protein